ncbi:hypothetical protein CGL56_02300 [Neolewinella marina]|uniref:Outer membrane protein beta-barrel domain-containing protein n=1 Tax=Neolewinella marina TaxID=438751 RepID=A0A2G0CIV3_9BACT|nr:hypothetical protein CGL56_02300 [Neolewinella marina]
MTRRFPTGRWFVPVGLRYDYGRREVTTSGMDDPQELFGPSYPVPTAGLSTAQAREEFRQPRELQTHTLAVRTGLGRRLSGRLTLEGGLQGGYLMGGSGPTYAVLDSAGVVSVTVAEERFSRSNYGGGGTQFDMSAGGGGNRSVLNPVLNRLSLSTWLRADYRLSGNLHLTLGTTRHLTPVYREGSPAMERQRLELGLRWGR